MSLVTVAVSKGARRDATGYPLGLANYMVANQATVGRIKRVRIGQRTCYHWQTLWIEQGDNRDAMHIVS